MELDFLTKHSCLLSYSWDWKEPKSEGKELHRLVRLYVPDGETDPYSYGQSVITTKDRIRGRGRSLSMKLTSPEGKFAKIHGIALMYTG